MSADIDRWNETLGLLALAPTPTLFALGNDLIARHREAHRHYHTLVHLDDCLTQSRAIRALFEHAGEVEFALWFHDAIYDTRKSDNEQRCADWARQSALAGGVDASAAQRIHALVMATRHAALPATPDAALLVDIDLSILGAEPDRYDAYAAAIREEYAHVPEPLYRAGRAAILGRFLESEALFADPIWAERHETQARANLTREIAALTA